MKKYTITENNIIYDIIEYDRGTKFWMLNNIFHREIGPAIEWSDGGKSWYKNGNRHRDDGPAAEYNDGLVSYWYNDIRLEHINSNEELKRYIKLLSIKLLYSN